MAATRSEPRRPAGRSKNGGAPARAAGGNGGGATARRERSPQRRAPSLDEVLVDAVQGPGQRWVPGRAAVELAGKLAVHPGRVTVRGLGLVGELAKVAVGRSELAPVKGDRRFSDPAWQGNPAFRRLLQAYLALGETADELISDAGLSWRADKRVRFAVENLLDAMAPTNAPLLNPAVLKAVIDTGGQNFLKGARALAGDMVSAPRIPSSVDSSQFELGKNVATSAGQVVLRTPVIELIQYTPSTKKVREIPVLIVGAMINKFYIADLSPGRSIVEHLVNSGQQTFAISWRNPTEDHADWGLDTYVQAVLDALDAIESITDSKKTHLMGLCAGGQTSSVTAAHLAAKGEGNRLAGLTLGVTVLDFTRMGRVGSFVDRATATTAELETARKGYLDGKTLAGVFAWLRPNDMIWNYWVNNYLMGKDPPAFDILFWNGDHTRMTAGLHRDFMEMSLENALAKKGAIEILGEPIDLSKVKTDTYCLAGISDHISPWQSAYRSAQLFGSKPRFVLSNSGHIAAMVNPPDNPKASFQLNKEMPADPQEWLDGATTTKGSWWEDWTAWLGKRSGDEKPAPRGLGDKRHEPLAAAPGTYVLEGS